MVISAVPRGDLSGDSNDYFWECIKKPLQKQRFNYYTWRRERDSNPRNAINAYTLSRRAPSATRTPLHNLLPFSVLLTSQEHDALVAASKA